MDDGSMQAAGLPGADRIIWEQQFVGENSPQSVNAPMTETFWSDVGKLALQTIATADGGSTITKAQLAQSIEEGKFSGAQAQIAAGLYDNFESIKKLSGDPAGAITPKDIQALVQAAPAAEKSFETIDDLAYWAEDQHNLERLSNNRSGVLKQQEIQNLGHRPDLSTDDKTMLASLCAHFGEIARNGIIGKAEMDQFYRHFQDTNDAFRTERALIEDMRAVSSVQHDPAAKRLFADGQNAINSINVDAVRQGFSGDCTFKAALAGLAAMRPQDILNMTRPGKNSTLAVKFPGVKGRSFDCAQPVAEEIGLYSPQSKYGYWPASIEKAYGKKVYAEAVWPKGSRLETELDAVRASSDGWQDHAIATLTGHKVDNLLLALMTEDQLRAKVLTAATTRRVACLTTEPEDSAEKTRDGFLKGHAFTVLGLTPDGKVLVRDPRAQGNNRPDGTMAITLAQLKANFRAISIETNEPI